jgi:hypothetical protein
MELPRGVWRWMEGVAHSLKRIADALEEIAENTKKWG